MAILLPDLGLFTLHTESPTGPGHHGRFALPEFTPGLCPAL